MSDILKPFIFLIIILGTTKKTYANMNLKYSYIALIKVKILQESDRKSCIDAIL